MSEGESSKPARKRILLADDEADIIMLVSTRLKAGGYDVITATDGEAALRMVREQKPDLVILDVMMPKLNGHQVCRLLKFDSNFRSIPVIILTARTQPADARIAGECGADAHMTKPLDSQEFLKKVAKLLGVAESH